MLNILFWNLNRNDIEDYIAECIGEHEIDIAVFAEYEGVKFPSLERKLGGKYTRITGIESDKKVTLVAKKTLAIRKVQTTNRYNLYSFDTGVKKYILAGVHLQDIRNYSAADREATIRDLKSNIEKNEDSFKCTNSIVIGDFNANPFGHELTSVHGFNAVLYRDIIEKSDTNKFEDMIYKRFYNPILHYISEETKMYGSLYNTTNDDTKYWYCLDQILVRKELANSIKNMQYLRKINAQNLIKSVAPKRNISDHLPLVVCLEETK
ncbi:endonuclease/exonuclease/phosphatase family protein [Lachnospiraceae bacterium JC7]|nr:endonuclease/exonuclease/phosphatase family protein [Lachnospiraceae bacterium JC7]